MFLMTTDYIVILHIFTSETICKFRTFLDKSIGIFTAVYTTFGVPRFRLIECKDQTYMPTQTLPF